MAINKESNVPNRGHLDKKKQVPLLYSTMLRRMYLKGPMSKSLTDESVSVDSPELDTQSLGVKKKLIYREKIKRSSPKVLSIPGPTSGNI